MSNPWGTNLASPWHAPPALREAPLDLAIVRPIDSTEAREALDVAVRGARRGDFLMPQALFLEHHKHPTARVDGKLFVEQVAALVDGPRKLRARAVTTVTGPDVQEAGRDLAPEAVGDRLMPTLPRTPEPRERLTNRNDVPREALLYEPLPAYTAPPGGGEGPYHYPQVRPSSAPGGLAGLAGLAGLGDAESGPRIMRLRESISAEPGTIYTSQGSQQPLRVVTTVSPSRYGRPYAMDLGAIAAISGHGAMRAHEGGFRASLPARGVGTVAPPSETVELFVGQQIDVDNVKNYVCTGIAARCILAQRKLRLVGNAVGEQAVKVKFVDGSGKTIRVKVRKPRPEEYVQAAASTLDGLVRAATNQRLVVDDWQDANLLRAVADAIIDMVNKVEAGLGGIAQIAVGAKTVTLNVCRTLRTIAQQLKSNPGDETLRQTVLRFATARQADLQYFCDNYSRAADNLAALRDLGNALDFARVLATGAQTFTASSREATSVVRSAQAITGTLSAIFPKYAQDPARLLRDLGRSICEAWRNPNALPIYIAVEKQLREKVVRVAPEVAAAPTPAAKLEAIQRHFTLDELTLVDPNSPSRYIAFAVPAFRAAWDHIQRAIMGDPSPDWQVDMPINTTSLSLLSEDTTTKGGERSDDGSRSARSKLNDYLVVGSTIAAVAILGFLVLRR